LPLGHGAPERVAAFIIRQNGDIYKDYLGPKYEALKKCQANPTPEGREKLGEAVNEEGVKEGFVSEVSKRLVE
jgi:hypothetical protein